MEKRKKWNTFSDNVLALCRIRNLDIRDHYAYELSKPKVNHDMSHAFHIVL